MLVPFLLCSLIWGSTWLVIKDQIANDIPPVWSVTYRFIIAASAMFFLTAFRRLPFRIDARGQVVAAILGVLQFTLNFNFVYNAEYYVTSGLVAVLFALLIIPNAVLGRIFLGQKITGSFVAGSIVAIAGVALLFVHEYRAAPGTADMVAWGVGFTLLGILSASIANVMQAAKTLKAYPIIPLLAWAMLWGAALNGLYAFITSGPPVWENDWSYFGGILWLGIAASAVTFPLYFGLIRQIGAAKAAYSSVLVPVTAMTLSTIFEGYVWSTLAIGGAVLAMAGLLIAMQARKKSV
ncbi:DMT family transporter [Sphingorhabdus sp. Alg239-R122]|uniref:DMT family transporter n=1 Tax=Sphingorhabdus sp. Alg239-R122 TaxID=2305989 RepID=UPI0013DBCF2F|nr:DMT family transporter [Sphingorhabdus sp. Alg239-R122]